MTNKHYGDINDANFAISMQRFYIRGCMERARWWRDEGYTRPQWRDRMEHEVCEARRLSRRIRDLLRERAEGESA